MEITKKSPKAYGYLRVSSSDQEKKGNWIPGQKTSIKIEADRQWIEIVQFYEDGGISWKYQSRDWLDRMLNNLKKANKKWIKIQYIIVDDIDRLARDIDVRRFIKVSIKETGASIYSLKQHLEDTPENQMMETIVMWVKQYERENWSRRVRDRQRARMLDGFWVFNVPLWYMYTEAENKRGKIVVPDPNNFSIIKEWLNLLAKGVLHNKTSLHKFLQNSGIKSKYGNKIYKSFIDNLLKRENLIFYAWFIDFPKWDLRMIKAKHEPAISETDFYKLVEKLKIKWFYKEYSENFINERLPLRQILICSHCWAKMTGGPSKGNGGIYFYYMCNNSACSHRKKSFNSDKVHQSIESFLETLTLDNKYMKGFEIVMNHFWDKKQDIKKSLYQQKIERIEEIWKKISGLVQKCMNAFSPTLITSYEKEIINLEEEKKILEIEIESGSEEKQEYDFIHHFDRLKSIIQAPIGIWNMGQIELKRLMINTLFEGTLNYSKELGIQTTKIPLIYDIFNNDECDLYNIKSFIKQKSTLTVDQTVWVPISTYNLNQNVIMVGDTGFEPVASCTSSKRSSQLS